MDNSILNLIRRIGLTSRQLGDALSRDLGLSESQGRFLAYIEAEADRGLIQRDLADMSGMRAASITGVLQNLEERGLVERRADPSDDRRKTVHITAAGTALVRRFRDAVREFDAESLAVLTADEQATLQSLLHKLDRSTTKGVAR